MNESTKLYAIKKSTHSMMWLGSGSDSIEAVYLSRPEAEYEVWKLEKIEERLRSKSTSFYDNFNHYRVVEVGLKNSTKEKNYSDFIEEKLAEIEKKRKEREACEEKDKGEIAKLNEETEYYKSLIS